MAYDVSDMFPSTVEDVLDPGAVAGSAMVQLGGSLLTYAVGRVVRQREITHLGADLVRAQVLTQAITQGIKFTTRRTRPDGSGLSFPSGHTAGAFASATVLQRHYGWKIGAPAYALAGYVAASRLSDNRHYLSDVVFGATIGVLAGRTVTIGHGAARFAMIPMVVRGGAGVSLVSISR